MPLTLKNFNIQPLPPLNFTANTANSTVQLKVWSGSPASVSLETSTDKVNWSPYTIGNTITLSNIWDKVFFRNTSTTDTVFSTASNYYQFVMSWSIAWGWDITYLLNKNWTDTLSSGCFYYLFSSCSSLTSAPSLPAHNLSYMCYGFMFLSCTSLTSVPPLPATTMSSHWYYYMFRKCTSLTTPPALPATTLNDNCYEWMFYQCSSLSSLPKLPATTLANGCYYYMFGSCTLIKISSSKTWAYKTEYRIPTTWSWTTASDALYRMFYSTWWTYTSDPSINTTYYTSNTLVW